MLSPPIHITYPEIDGIPLTLNEYQILKLLRNIKGHASITIKVNEYGNFRRITYHQETDVFLEEKTSRR